MNKVYATSEAALDGLLFDGMTVAAGGFGLCGIPENLIDGLLRIYRNHLTLLDYSENDTLTGLLNRRTFEDVFARRISRQSLADEMSRHIEYVGQRRIPSAGETPWLAVIDIDIS